MRNYHNLIDAYLSYTKNHEATVRVHQWAFISVVAAACERKIWLPRGFYTLFPNLYVFIIGRSGLIKKSTSTGVAVNMLREIRGVRMMSERLTAAALIQQMSLAGKKFEYDGNWVKQSPVFAYASELSVFMEEIFGGITGLLTTFYDCQPADSSKPWSHCTKGEGSVDIYGPCLNFLGASTKTWLRKCIPRTEMEGGFTSRIIFVVENNLPDRLIAWPQVDIDGELVRKKIVEDLQHIHGLTGEFRVSDRAKEMFTVWYEHHMTNIMPMNQDPRMVGYMSRKGDTILKLAMIHSVACNDSMTIQAKDLMWASNEMDALEGDWRLAFDGLSTNNLAFELRNYVRTKIRVNKKEVLKMFTAQYPADEVATHLQNLREMDEICDELDAKGNPTGWYSFRGSDLMREQAPE